MNNGERGKLPALSDIICEVFTHPGKDAFSTGFVYFFLVLFNMFLSR